MGKGDIQKSPVLGAVALVLGLRTLPLALTWAFSQLCQLSWVLGHIWVNHPRVLSSEEEACKPGFQLARCSLKQGSLSPALPLC